MKTKFHIGIIIVLLSLIGVHFGHTILPTPNQQIVIEFSETSFNFEETENVISHVKSKLQTIGIEPVAITELDSGQLRITYYSDSNIEFVQDKLSEDFLTLNSNADNESEKGTDLDYSFNISEIHNQIDNDWGFNGIQVSETNQKSDRFNHFKFKTFRNLKSIIDFGFLNTNKLKSDANNIVVTNSFSYQFPEVRAGPIQS